MNLVPSFGVDNCIVFAGIGRTFVNNFANIRVVVKHSVKVFFVDFVAAWCQHPTVLNSPSQFSCRPNLKKTHEDPADFFSSLLVHQQLAIFHMVAIGRGTAHKYSLHARCFHLVADPLGSHLALELRKTQ